MKQNLFLKDILNDIPISKYKSRLAQELSDHLEDEQVDFMLNKKMTKKDANNKIIERIGKKEEIIGSYKEFLRKTIGKFRFLEYFLWAFLVMLIIIPSANYFYTVYFFQDILIIYLIQAISFYFIIYFGYKRLSIYYDNRKKSLRLLLLIIFLPTILISSLFTLIEPRFEIWLSVGFLRGWYFLFFVVRFLFLSGFFYFEYWVSNLFLRKDKIKFCYLSIGGILLFSFLVPMFSPDNILIEMRHPIRAGVMYSIWDALPSLFSGTVAFLILIRTFVHKKKWGFLERKIFSTPIRFCENRVKKVRKWGLSRYTPPIFIALSCSYIFITGILCTNDNSWRYGFLRRMFDGGFTNSIFETALVRCEGDEDRVWQLILYIFITLLIVAVLGLLYGLKIRKSRPGQWIASVNFIIIFYILCLFFIPNEGVKADIDGFRGESQNLTKDLGKGDNKLDLKKNLSEHYRFDIGSSMEEYHLQQGSGGEIYILDSKKGKYYEFNPGEKELVRIGMKNINSRTFYSEIRSHYFDTCDYSKTWDDKMDCEKRKDEIRKEYENSNLRHLRVKNFESSEEMSLVDDEFTFFDFFDGKELRYKNKLIFENVDSDFYISDVVISNDERWIFFELFSQMGESIYAVDLKSI